MGKINQTIINFDVYEGSNRFYGMADVSLPEIAFLTETLQGAGIAGEVESTVLGHISAMNATINFRTVCTDIVALTEPRVHEIELRAAQQKRDSATGTTSVESIKYVLRAEPKKMAPGKLAPSSTGDASVEMSASYFAQFIDGEKVIEIDQLNDICYINGVDYLEDVRTALGY